MEIRLLASSALLALLVAGCASPPSAPRPQDPPADATDGLPLPWTLAGCRELAVFFEAPPSAVKPFFPSGFEPGPGLTPSTTTVGMDAFRCESAGGAHGDVPDASYASFWAVATPPQALQGDVRQWYVKWMALVPDPQELSVLQPLTPAATSGEVSFADATPAAPAPATCTVTIAGIGTATIMVGPEGSPPAGGGGGAGVRLREYTLGSDGASVLVWEATLTRPSQALGSGTLDVPAGSVLAQIAGATRIPVVVADGQGGGLSNGTITRAPLA